MFDFRKVFFIHNLECLGNSIDAVHRLSTEFDIELSSCVSIVHVKLSDKGQMEAMAVSPSLIQLLRYFAAILACKF